MTLLTLQSLFYFHFRSVVMPINSLLLGNTADDFSSLSSVASRYLYRKPHVVLVKRDFFNTSIAMATVAWRTNSVLISKGFFPNSNETNYNTASLNTASSNGQDYVRVKKKYFSTSLEAISLLCD